MLRGHCQICGISGSKRSMKPAMKSAQLDQGLIARLVVEKELGFRSPDRHERHIGRGSPEGEAEVEHRSDGAGPREVAEQGQGIEAGGRIGDGGIV